MKFVKQLGWILLFSIVAEVLATVIPLPVPAAIYGIVLLLIALCTGFLKPESIADTAKFFITIMPILFVAPAANILKNWGLITPHLLPICIIVVVSTVIVFVVGGLMTKLLLGKETKKNA